MIRVIRKDLRVLGYCGSGARAFFKRQGWDWSVFVREGLPVELFEATGDAMAMRVAEEARARHGR